MTFMRRCLIGEVMELSHLGYLQVEALHAGVLAPLCEGEGVDGGCWTEPMRMGRGNRACVVCTSMHCIWVG